MSKKVKVKNIKQITGSGDINGLFEEMMGTRDAEPEIIRPKFVKVRNLIRHVYRVLMQFAHFSALQTDFPETKEGMLQITEFANAMKNSIVFNAEKGTPNETEEKYMNLSKVELNSYYKKIKDNEYVKSLIVLGGTLKRHSRFIDDKNNLKDNFIGQEPGLSFTIFQFSTLDLKILWANKRITFTVKQYILNVLHTLWKDTYEIYRIVTSPDVDIDKFTKLLIESIGRLKKEPGLNRCNNAFNRIENSVHLLKDKFGDYYRESVASSNPNMIVESFIIDVSNQGGANARLTREFRQIIQYMHKVGAQTGKNKDPKIQKLFKMLNSNFNIMEKQSAAVGPITSQINDEEPNLEDVDTSFKTDTNKNTIKVYKPAKTSSVVSKKKKSKKKSKRK